MCQWVAIFLFSRKVLEPIENEMTPIIGKKNSSTHNFVKELSPSHKLQNNKYFRFASHDLQTKDVAILKMEVIHHGRSRLHVWRVMQSGWPQIQSQSWKRGQKRRVKNNILCYLFKDIQMNSFLYLSTRSYIMKDEEIKKISTL